jgi:hypothetical protein
LAISAVLFFSRRLIMLSRQMEFADEQELLFVEQAQAMFRELSARAREAPDGQVLATAETLAVARGRELTRKALERVVQTEITAGEKKGRRPEPVPAAAGGITAARAVAKSSRRPAR